MESLPVIHSSRRLPELDGLRGIAVGMVVLYHVLFFDGMIPTALSRLAIVGRLGWSGVDLFFVLSGFLIGGILLDERASANYFSTFYLRRAYRILPIYFLLLCLFTLHFVLDSGGLGAAFSQSRIPWYAYFSFTQNIWMAVLGTVGLGMIAPTWSLAVEEQFYLTAPLVIRKVSRTALSRLLIGAVVAAPVLRTVVYLASQHKGVADYVSMPCRADALSLGMLTALIARTPHIWSSVVRHVPVLKSISIALFLGLLALLPWGEPYQPAMVMFGYSWLALFYTSVLLIAVSCASGWLGRALRSPILASVGTVSYFVYLFHLPFMEVTCRILWLRFPRDSATVHFFGSLLGAALTLAAAKLSWAYFEKPLLRRAHRYHY